MYYGSYDLTLPVKSWMIPVFIAFIMAIFAILSASLKPVVRFKVFEKKGAYSGRGRRSGPEILTERAMVRAGQLFRAGQFFWARQLILAGEAIQEPGL